MTILQARRYQKKDADLDAVAASGLAAAWTAYTPTVTAGSGTFTTVSATGRYVIMGKITFVTVSVTITTNGTAAGTVRATLPSTPAQSIYMLAGRETTLTGNFVQGRVFPAGYVEMTTYNNLYPGASGAMIIVSGSYENA